MNKLIHLTDDISVDPSEVTTVYKSGKYPGMTTVGLQNGFCVHVEKTVIEVTRLINFGYSAK